MQKQGLVQPEARNGQQQGTMLWHAPVLRVKSFALGTGWEWDGLGTLPKGRDSIRGGAVAGDAQALGGCC